MLLLNSLVCTRVVVAMWVKRRRSYGQKNKTTTREREMLDDCKRDFGGAAIRFLGDRLFGFPPNTVKNNMCRPCIVPDSSAL